MYVPGETGRATNYETPHDFAKRITRDRAPDTPNLNMRERSLRNEPSKSLKTKERDLCVRKNPGSFPAGVRECKERADLAAVVLGSLTQRIRVHFRRNRVAANTHPDC